MACCNCCCPGDEECCKAPGPYGICCLPESCCGTEEAPLCCDDETEFCCEQICCLNEETCCGEGEDAVCCPEDECCVDGECGPCECEGDEDCPEGECCNDGECGPCGCDTLADCPCSAAGEGWSEGGTVGDNFTCCPPGTFYAGDDYCECYDPDCPEYPEYAPAGGRQAILDFESVQCCLDGSCAPAFEACPP
jgi:hypothetical protein